MVLVKQRIDRFLTDDGTPTGDKSAAKNYTTPGEVYIQPPTGHVFHLHRMFIEIEDDGVWSSEKYGSLATLTNGIHVKVMEGSTVLANLTDGIPVKSISHWSRYCYDMRIDTVGPGNSFASIRWTFERDSPSPITINAGQRLAIQMSDDLSGLTGHYFMAKGTGNTLGKPREIDDVDVKIDEYKI